MEEYECAWVAQVTLMLLCSPFHAPWELQVFTVTASHRTILQQ